ncbi:pentapeptide repeat-containing protein [Streptomyces sp. IB2014 016-6]|uniref:pentapeptide repeat-containing protein n=1 Tax=Streptomyces sp. IB2014 016-6 TaxID=2517818 RepID=UPI001F4FF8D7|nr:pentapeptide repeat-containing protein [Streptomyces sp. IB2014 016-6]
MARRIELVSVLIASLVAVAGLWYSSVQTRQANDHARMANDQARQDRALMKEGQITDRYTAAVNNLGEDKMDVRLGGIYALQRIMQDSPRDHRTISNVLAAYVRTHAVKPPRKGQGAPAADIYAALTVLGTRNAKRDGKDFQLDLRNTQLPDYELMNADLSRAMLSGTDLTGAWLTGVDLSYAIMLETDFTGAKFNASDLTGAILTGSDFTGTTFMDVDMNATNLNDVDLTGADLSDVSNLTRDQIEFARTDGETRLPNELL